MRKRQEHPNRTRQYQAYEYHRNRNLRYTPMQLI
jgi:hypothetical protein